MGLFGVAMLGIGFALIQNAGKDASEELPALSSSLSVPQEDVSEEREPVSDEAESEATSASSAALQVPEEVQRNTALEETSGVPSIANSEEGRLAAKTLLSFARAMMHRTSVDDTQRALASQGFQLELTEPTRGATGVRSKGKVVPQSASQRAAQSAFLEGEVVFEGNEGSALVLEHARLVYASLKVSLETLRGDLGDTLTGDGWEQSPGPRGESTLWRHSGKGLLVSLRKYAPDEPKPWDGFPSEGVVVSVQRDHE
ncbi:MAG: hypothetical protein IOD12_01860 [Silvanigrellales bacterium]|nr:hypothetical protein [Silvanigrellales bacterium]